MLKGYMRKFLITLVTIFYLSNSVALCFAGTPVKKLCRGVVNVLTFPLEVPKQTYLEFQRGRAVTFHVSVWILSGFVKGTVYSFGRLLSGTWDVVSFPLNHPQDYTPIMRPDFVFQR